ncbi:MAG TPA: FkbM family methyltransferase [Bryobacteraceae bacterium]|nr:FkbM family methyltransferase [Bryobacteraceae bacterium]
MRRTLRYLIVILLVGLALVWFYPPARLLALVAAGRSPVCPLANALKSDENLRLEIRYNNEILKASRLVETDPAGYELWDTPSGRFWIPVGSQYVLPFNLAEQKRRIYGNDQQSAHAGDIVLDCGANVGVTVRVWLEAGAKQVVAIEPAPENIECLRRNFKNEIAAGRVIIYPKGVWDKDEIMPMQIDPKNSAADSFLIRREGGTEVKGIPLTTIDKLVAELKLERVDFIKMDIEGAEPRALAGGRETIARWHPRLALCTYHAPDHPRKVPEMVKAAWPGYTMECGPCAEANHAVRPDVLYFH